jgi:hypothetical protein
MTIANRVRKLGAPHELGVADLQLGVAGGRHAYGYLRTGLKWRCAGHTYTVAWSSANVKGQLRFCAEAYDPSGNESARSRARIVTS